MLKVSTVPTQLNPYTFLVITFTAAEHPTGAQALSVSFPGGFPSINCLDTVALGFYVISLGCLHGSEFFLGFNNSSFMLS